MGRPEAPLERDGSPVREFAFWLRALRNSSNRTYASLANETRYATTTLQAACAGERLPTLQVTMAIVRACHGPAEAWHRYWTRVKQAIDPAAPAGSWPVEPPPEIREPARWELGSSLSGLAVDVPDPVAEPAATRSEAPDGWYVRSFTARLRLDTPQPEARERREIVAAVDGLCEVATSISVPRHPRDDAPGHRLEASVEFGGTLMRREQPFESVFRHMIALPAPLRRGESHTYVLVLRIPPGQPMAPHYVYIPLCRSDRFVLEVRFPPDRAPALVRLLNGVTPAVIGEPESGEPLTPNRLGEIRAEFTDLQQGLGYGLRWRDEP